MLAIAVMSPEVQAMFYLVAMVLLFLAGLVWPAVKYQLGWFGAACFVFVFFWNALAAATV